LNHDPKGPAFEHGDRMSLNRLKLAIKYRQKKVNFLEFNQVKVKLNIRRACSFEKCSKQDKNDGFLCNYENIDILIQTFSFSL